MFSEKLKKLRIEKGLTQERLGQIIFVSRSAIAKWEQGKGIPNKESLKLLSEYFKIAPDELLKEEEPVLIIENMNKNYKKSKLLLTLCFAIIIVILMVLLTTIIFVNNNYRKKEGFYKEDFLIDNGLVGLTPVEGSVGYYSNDGTYFCTVLSSDKMHNYAKYLYEFLNTSLNISYLSTNFNEYLYEEKTGYQINHYLIRTSKYTDHFIESSNEYKFYYINNLENDRKKGEKVYPVCITIKMPFKRLGEEYIDSNGYDYNFTMRIFKAKEHENYGYYLGHEYFTIGEVEITSKNWMQYYDKEECITDKGIYITLKGINKKVECICFLYCNIYIEVEVEDTKYSTRDIYKKNIYKINVDDYITEIISAQELGNYSDGSKHITQCNVEYEILDGSKLWILTKK